MNVEKSRTLDAEYPTYQATKFERRKKELNKNLRRNKELKGENNTTVEQTSCDNSCTKKKKNLQLIRFLHTNQKWKL